MKIEFNSLQELNDFASRGTSQTQSDPENDLLWVKGKKYFIRTVTHHHTGVFVGFSNERKEVVLEQAAWIADDGRLTDALKTGTFNEVEMFPGGSRVGVGRGSIIDAVQITDIPVSQK